MVAAIFVVFLHVSFPSSKAQGLMFVLANSAVPLFFAITGYFNYGASQRTLTRRIKHLLRLYLVAMLASVAFGIITTELTGGSSVAFLITYFPKWKEIMNWLILQQDPRNGQLWYLTSACLCYLILYLYVRFFGDKPVNYRPLYYAAFSLFAVFLALGCLAAVVGMNVPYLLYRNGFFCGLPMFTLGIFLREYQDRILTNFNLTSGKLLALALAGFILGIMQYFTVGMGQGGHGYVAGDSGAAAVHDIPSHGHKGAGVPCRLRGEIRRVVDLRLYPAHADSLRLHQILPPCDADRFFGKRRGLDSALCGGGAVADCGHCVHLGRTAFEAPAPAEVKNSHILY